MKREIAVGIDIGGTNTVFGLITKDGICLSKSSVSTQSFIEIHDFIAAIACGVESLVKTLPDEIQILGLGVGAPNGNFYNGTIENAPNLRWKGFIPLADLFKKQFDYPVFVTNDANAAALGEMIYGGARGMKDFLLITLGTGLGSGYVAHGEIIYGHDGFAGELGHVVIDFNGRNCACGRKGCLETYVSATGIVRTVAELLGIMTDDSDFRSIPYSEINSRLIFEKARAGDKIAIRAFELTGEILGKALANTVAITSPEAIFMFGGLALSGDLIFYPTITSMEKNLLGIFQNKVKILPSQLGENAAILGASALVWKELGRIYGEF
jgi:glucokinase